LPCSTASRRNGETAGFTLIEVLIALSVVAITLAAIGSLVATSIRGTRALDVDLTAIATARAIMTVLPRRSELKPGSRSGVTAEHRWRVDVTSLKAPTVDSELATRWAPQAVTIRVQSPTGSILELNTIRLRRREEN
jgi:general secretion pathway protein I